MRRRDPAYKPSSSCHKTCPPTPLPIAADGLHLLRQRRRPVWWAHLVEHAAGGDGGDCGAGVCEQQC